MDQESEIVRTYSGRGWGFFRLSGLGQVPGWFAVPITVFGALIVAFIVGALIWRAFGSLLAGSPDDIYKILLTLAGAVGAPFVVWRTIVAHQQTVISRESHYTSLFTKAVEQLGATREVVGDTPRTEPNLEVRLGAIYALERIAKDSERDHWPIMEVLCAYVRNVQNCGSPIKPSAQDKDSHAVQWLKKLQEPRVDIQAAITVIGRRPAARIAHETERKLRLDFSGANLQKARFSGNFRAAIFSSANLARAEFNGCIMKGDELEGPDISGIRLSDSKFDQFEMVFAEDIVGLHAYRCQFPNAFIGVSFHGCSFSNCDFSGADFSRLKLVGLAFSGSNFSNASFVSSVFSGHCSMSKCDLTGTDFRDADMRVVKSLQGSDLQKSFGDQGTFLSSELVKPEAWDKIPPSKKLSEEVPF